MQNSNKESILTHVYMILSWNLMCRANNTSSICLNHLEWRNDSLGIYFAHMKNDQGGDRPRDARHVYANPIMPEVCSILSLSVYFYVFLE